MIKKSLLLIYRVAFWLIGIVLFVFMITALVLHFWLMPNVNQHKNNIAIYASKTLHQKVMIGDIKANWQGINPHLSLSNITLFDAENRPALQLSNTSVALSWLSIPLLEPHLAELVIRAPELTIRRMPNDEIFVAGMSMSGKSNPELANWLLRQNKFEISNAKVIWLDEKRSAPSLALEKLNIEVFTPAWRSLVKNHSVIISATPSVGTLNPIQLAGSFYGDDISHTEKWHGNFKLQIKNANLIAFKPWVDYASLMHQVDLQSGTGSADVNLTFSNHQIQAISSDVSLKNSQLQLPSNANPLVLNSLSGKISWENLNKNHLFSIASQNTPSNQPWYSLQVENLNLASNTGFNLHNANANYTQTLAGEKSLNLNLAQLNLSALQPYLVQLPLPDAVLNRITGMAASGTLNHIDAHWKAQHDITTDYEVEADFNQLSLQAYEKTPGFTNLSGHLQANIKQGQLQLNAQNAKLDFKDILRWSIPADQLSGKITWVTNKNITTIDVHQLNIRNTHLSGSINARYLMDGIKGGHLDLTGQFGNGNAKYAPFYYPIMLGETTLHWLDTSILAGTAEDINLTVKGRLADFPYVDSKNNLDPKLGLFRVTAKVSDALLEYGTGWPVIDKLGINLLFEGKRMELNAHTGNIVGNKIIKSKTTIAQLDADYPILNIDSEVIGPVNSGIHFVNKSPVVEVTQGFTEDLITSGTGKLNLGLSIPMQDLEAAKYKGLYQISNGKMQSESIPTLSQINGTLAFTESSLTAKNIKATAFGSPLSFNLASSENKSIRVLAQGKLSNESIQQLFKQQNLAKVTQYISGSADWVGDISIQKPRVNVAIRSNLNGITSRLPIPLNKSVTQPFNLRVDKNQDAMHDTLSISLDNKINAKIVRTMQNGKFQLDYANVAINQALSSTSPSNAKGIQITGQLDYLDGDAWRTVWNDISDASHTQVALPLHKVALKINALDIFDRRLNQLTLNSKPALEGVQANIQSREITGDIQWLNQHNGKLIARLSNFIIPEDAPHKLSNNVDNITLTHFTQLEQDYPALDVVIENFTFNKKNLGTLELNADPQNNNWNIQKLKLSTADSSLNAEGQWNNWAKNPSTYLNITWSIKDLGKALKRFGYAETIKDGTGDLTGILHWPGSPHQFDTSRLNGELQFEIAKGQILQVQPGVGRLLGLLSLQSLPRRLTLDFRDLFSNGFAFDKINATVKINHGVMSSDNFAMSGPAAEVTIKGETDLQKETQHLYVKVFPRVSDTLSLAALAGGPLAGAVAFLAQKILKDPLNKIASSEYEIIGTWDNPQEVKSNNENKPVPSSPLD
ncbi:MAG: TIGR02099 family protein [Methylotenera sp.]|nr:TIGR02099 family protein [Methylotenera sp.]